LLEVAQAERATGTLTLRQNGARSTTLYFLFGHLFHAMGESGSGDDAVLHALDWSAGEFDFDAKAKLPADETVRSSIPELLERSGGAAPGTNSRASSKAPATEASEEPAPQPEQPQDQAPEPAPPAPETPPEAWVPPAETRSEEGSRDGNSERAQRAPANQGRPEPRQERAERAEPRPAYRSGESRRSFRQRPQPRHGREAIPVPAGQVMYDSLKTSFVDFPRLITTLEREGHTG
jgi:hypothetical protein